MPELTDNEFYRYDRQIALRGFDIDGQRCLKNSSAVIIGVGGLGCAASLYLASAGIGKLTLIDFDTVSKTNLSRQILYTQSSIGKYKVDEAKRALSQNNPDLQIETVNQQLDDQQLNQLVALHTLAIDCTDNLMSREQINRSCYANKKPLISGAAIRMEGLLCVFTYQHDEPCYQCISQLFGHDELTCAESGVMSPLVGLFGSMQALEAIKVITHYGKPLRHRLLMVDAFSMQFTEIYITKSKACPVCRVDT